MCAVLRDRISPALSKIKPAIANGISNSSGNAARMWELSGVTLASPFGNVLARHKNQPQHFNRHTSQTKGRLRRNGVQQADGRNRNKPPGRHEKEAREFQSS